MVTRADGSRAPKARRMAKGGRAARAVAERAPALGWLTSDQDEIGIRRWRGRTDIVEVVTLEAADGFFGRFEARSTSGSRYDVEIRDLEGSSNSCACIDHRVNRLGTCKHVEGVLAALGHRGVRAFRKAARTGSPWIELFLDRRAEGTPALTWPSAADEDRLAPARAWLSPWLRPDGTLANDPEAIAALIDAWAEAPDAVAAVLRVSCHFGPWLARAERQRHRALAREAFEGDLAAGRATLDVLSHSLLPYQRLGALHLAFGERALLADDMGLGKTIQAIAACELLARRTGVARVLVVCPASLKAEWEEQIARFTQRASRLAFGPRAVRLAAYREPSFFTIVNYEQVLGDADDLNDILKPDIVILDEAQRIKNWPTKTARRVKALRSAYAFVLTGTPIENRIDELYSIVQYLDPEVLGPLFRFNRDFYQLDERGRPVGYQNLAALRERVRPFMLRRRKADVERELPGRTVKTFFVPMAEEQKLRYEEDRGAAAQLIAIAQRRPLTPKEFDRLQQRLACMRMVCDTPAILDPTCRVSPKLEELERILGDLLEEPDRKVIVFSEWERMLAMVRDLAGEMGVEAAWHTGSLPQDRRRQEINRFKHDPTCRLFLSTDSGSVGLNLQVASAVVNVDLPWNPAKLEQRIARAWRKNQTRSVAVINLVTEGSIEHSILHLLGQKQALADGVIDGEGDLAALTMPSGRGAFIARMQAMMDATAGAPPRLVSREADFCADLVRRLGESVMLVELRETADARNTVLAVLDLDPVALAAERARPGAGAVEFIDKASFIAMQRLAAAGLVRFPQRERTLHRSPLLAEAGEAAPALDEAQAGAAMGQAERAVQMAKVLAGGGFFDEVPVLLGRSLRRIGVALTTRHPDVGPAHDDALVRRLVDRAALPAEALTILDQASPGGAPLQAAEADALIASSFRILAFVRTNEPGLSARSGAGS